MVEGAESLHVSVHSGPGGQGCPTAPQGLGVGRSTPHKGPRGTQAAPCTILCRPADLAALLPDLSGRLLINSVFHVGAERLQQMLFSDSPFLQDFLQQCKFTGQGLRRLGYQGRAWGGAGQETGRNRQANWVRRVRE